MPKIYYAHYNSPVGNLLLLVQNEKLIYLEFEKEQQTTPLEKFVPIDKTNDQNWAIFCKTFSILDRYFECEAIDFAQLDFLAPQGTPFQKMVWQKLREIPFGKATTYGSIAQSLNKPNAVRAVGGAVGRNPISILIPCHRVLGKNQTLTGFGGGLPNKRFLLDLEQIRYKDQGIEFVKPKNKTFK